VDEISATIILQSYMQMVSIRNIKEDIK